MKKLFLIFVSLISANALFGAAVLRRVASTRIGFRRFYSTANKTHADYVDDAAQHIPQSKLMQNLLEEFTHIERIHPATVLKASFLSVEEQEEIILKALLQAEKEGKPEHKLVKTETFIRNFISDSTQARRNAPEAFETARRARIFWGRYHYDLNPQRSN